MVSCTAMVATGEGAADSPKVVKVDFEASCVEQEARFMAAYDVDLFGGRVAGLFGTAMDEQILAVFANLHEGFQRVSEGIDGFSVHSERLLAWSFEPGKLVLLEAGTAAGPVSLWQGSVSPQARPRLASGGVWWLTEHEGTLRAAWAELSEAAAGGVTARLSPPLVESERFSLVFSDRAALLQAESQDRAWLWRREGDWRPLEIASTLRVVVAAGSSFVAWDGVAGEWRLAEDSRSGLEWGSLWRAVVAEPPTYEPRFYGEADSLRMTFAEPDGPSIRLTHLGLGAEARVVTVAGGREPPRAAFDGHSLAVLRHRHGELALELCGRELLDSMRATPEVAVAPAQPATIEPALVPRPSAPIAGVPARARALQWMRAQLGPVLDFGGRRGRLIDSYEDERRAGWVYDASLAVIVFSAARQEDVARQLLVGLEHLQDADGSWSFAYDPDRAQALESDRYVGAIAWVVIAANFYEWQTGDPSFSEMAIKALRFIERFQSKDPTAREFGGVAMGPGRRREFSAEHNADAYSAFLWRGRLEKNGRLLETAGEIRRFVLATLWAGSTPGGGRRYFKVGSRDATLFLDPQTWITLSLGVGADEESIRLLGEALLVAERYLQVHEGSGSEVLVGFNEASGPDISSKIWPEGTEGMVAALRVIGDHDKAAFYHRETARLQTASGGIPYATANQDGWSTRPAVASTAWFLVNEFGVNPFHPGEPSGSGAVASVGAAGKGE